MIISSHRRKFDYGAVSISSQYLLQPDDFRMDYVRCSSNVFTNPEFSICLSLSSHQTKAIETGMILLIMDMKKKTFMYFFHRSISTEIREFAAIVLWKLVMNFGYRGRTVLA